MTPARLTVCLVTGLQALLVAAVAVYYLVELGRGEGADGAGVISSVVLFVIVAGALAILAAGWWRRAAWPRTATIVWNLVLAPVTVALVQAGQMLLGVGLGVVVVVAVVSAVAVPGRSGHGTDEGAGGPDVGREGGAVL
ncbi:MAG: hypothetical protein M3Y71_03780 [Actinomycetota bacterium]|nr:hypothetical protein [Actinomycetota bacterium]